MSRTSNPACPSKRLRAADAIRLRFGPMKPMGLIDPRTGAAPTPAVQLRLENLRADSYNLVGFQNHLKFGEQKRILRMIPGLENAEFLRYGQIHRNTYINAPALLERHAATARRPRRVLRRPDLRRGRLCRINRHRFPGRDVSPRLSPPINGSRRCLAKPHSDRCATTSRQPIRNTISPQISLSISSLRSMTPLRNRLRHDKPARHAEICRRAQAALEGYMGTHV